MTQTFEILCTATATIRERWLIRANDADHARELWDNGLGCPATFVDDEVLDDERDREIESVTPYRGKWPDKPDDEGDAAHLVRDAAPDLLDFVGMISRMETESEFDERTDGDGMSGDDAVDAISSLINQARELVAKAEGRS